jgi:hypothetical protein
MSNPNFTTSNATDIEISYLVGLETYKGLYFYYPNLYSYISYDLYPSNYYRSLVAGVIATSGLSYELAGETIRNTLIQLCKNETPSEANYSLVLPLIQSSYKIVNLKQTPLENFLWISITIFLATFIIVYLYYVNFWNYLFNNVDGIACYECPSIFDRFF